MAWSSPLLEMTIARRAGGGGLLSARFAPARSSHRHPDPGPGLGVLDPRPPCPIGPRGLTSPDPARQGRRAPARAGDPRRPSRPGRRPFRVVVVCKQR
ncbi:hypothetical protein NL676_008615 [Syzygium grande]|nr:hypothetical protein NL676_008615 [Syzygium grande]